jgi:hypothetical protein
MTRVTLVESRGGRCRLRAVGEFDRDDCDQFPAAVRVALAGYCSAILVDLAGARAELAPGCGVARRATVTTVSPGVRLRAARR